MIRHVEDIFRRVEASFRYVEDIFRRVEAIFRHVEDLFRPRKTSSTLRNETSILRQTSSV